MKDAKRKGHVILPRASPVYQKPKQPFLENGSSSINGNMPPGVLMPSRINFDPNRTQASKVTMPSENPKKRIQMGSKGKESKRRDKGCNEQYLGLWRNTTICHATSKQSENGCLQEGFQVNPICHDKGVRRPLYSCCTNCKYLF